MVESRGRGRSERQTGSYLLSVLAVLKHLPQYLKSGKGIGSTPGKHQSDCVRKRDGERGRAVHV